MLESLAVWVFPLLGFVAGGVFVFKRYRIGDLKASLSSAEQDVRRAQEQLTEKEERLQSICGEHKQLQSDFIKAEKALSSAQSDMKHLREQLLQQDKQNELRHEQMKKDFELLANRIFEEKGEKLNQRNEERVGRVLEPVQEKLAQFRDAMEKLQNQGGRDHAALMKEIEGLSRLNQHMSDEAKNLTRALKGENKRMGNWGEMVLERVLEISGLVKGEEYKTQMSVKGEDSKRLQPDVVVYLPENKHVIIDSKVSLVAYERYCDPSTDTASADVALAQHIQSTRAHIDDLSKKAYSSAKDLRSPDFVLMFIPIEPAFHLLLKEDTGLLDAAFSKKVVLVTPTTLLASLKTIASIWRLEKQSRNAEKIADAGGRLYDKFAGFVESMENIGSRLKLSQDAYDKAYNQLTAGRGNLLRQTSQLKDLGAKTSKQIPERLLEDASDAS